MSDLADFPDDKVITDTVADEMRRVREARGWSRPTLLQRLKRPMPVNTYATYEQGIRVPPMSRLVELCEALEVRPSDLISLALQRIHLDMRHGGVWIDLHQVLVDDAEELAPLRHWAKVRLNVLGEATPRLPWPVVEELAVLCGVPTMILAGFPPEVVPLAKG